MTVSSDRFKHVEVASIAELRAWLAAQYGQSEGVWLVRFRKGDPRHVDRLALLDELLCFGWIDGIARKVDDARTMQLISPRRHQAWSLSYKERVARLADEGRMAEPGLEAIRVSQSLGLWDHYAEVDALSVPQDLRRSLDAARTAAAYFDGAPPSYRRNVLRWLSAARRPATRATRVTKLVELSSLKERVPQM